MFGRCFRDGAILYIYYFSLYKIFFPCLSDGKPVSYLTNQRFPLLPQPYLISIELTFMCWNAITFLSILIIIACLESMYSFHGWIFIMVYFFKGCYKYYKFTYSANGTTGKVQQGLHRSVASRPWFSSFIKISTFSDFSCIKSAYPSL